MIDPLHRFISMRINLSFDYGPKNIRNYIHNLMINSYILRINNCRHFLLDVSLYPRIQCDTIIDIIHIIPLMSFN